MKHKINLADGTVHLINITSAYFKTWHVWKVQFDNGKVAMLYKMGNEWMQRTDDYLEAHIIDAIGKCIDKIIINRNNIAY